MSKKRAKPKKRTQRAITARRTDEQNEAVAREYRDKWWKALKQAMAKVEHYDKRVAYYAGKRIRKEHLKGLDI